MSTNTPINPAKKTFAAVQWAVQKVRAAYSFVIQKMGGVVAVTGAILAAVNAYANATIGKAASWIEDKLARGIPIVVGFLATMLTPEDKTVLRKILEWLT